LEKNKSGKKLMPIIYEPKTMNSLLNILKKYPNVPIFSGGLESILMSRDKILSLPENIIYIGKNEELQKIKRSERYLEIGACAVINTIIEKGKNILPPVFLTALKHITPPNLRNILTIGGLICSKKERNNIFTVLSILDAKVEIKSISSSKWINIGHLFEGNRINIEAGEILTKIRISLEEYDINIYKEIDNDFTNTGGLITFSAIGTLFKSNINVIKFIFSISDTFVIRDTDVESYLSGQNIPVNKKLSLNILNIFDENIKKKYESIVTYRRNIIVNTLKWFINELDSYYLILD
jgi:CO/xanthine dehydrogenase FAD-binding subunit